MRLQSERKGRCKADECFEKKIPFLIPPSHPPPHSYPVPGSEIDLNIIIQSNTSFTLCNCSSSMLNFRILFTSTQYERKWKEEKQKKKKTHTQQQQQRQRRHGSGSQAREYGISKLETCGRLVKTEKKKAGNTPTTTTAKRISTKLKRNLSKVTEYGL